MELTTTITCRTRVVATLEETGELSLKAFAETEYAPGRTTSADVGLAEFPEAVRAELKTALEAALTAAAATLGPRIAAARLKSAEVAATYGEI